ncbi:MAG: hypothetical protein AAFX41_17990 [Bacteroidota bacterium]
MSWHDNPLRLSRRYRARAGHLTGSIRWIMAAGSNPIEREARQGEVFVLIQALSPARRLRLCRAAARYRNRSFTGRGAMVAFTVMKYCEAVQAARADIYRTEQRKTHATGSKNATAEVQP